MFFQNPYGSGGNVVSNPSLPYNGVIPGGLQVGKRIQVTGFVRPFADSFRFDLRTNYGAIALHINPRFHAGCIVRNTERGGWQHEERSGPMIFQKGAGYELSITCEPSQFNVVINGMHAFNYVHRLPYQEITQFGVEGDIEVHRIVFHGHGGGGDVVRSPSIPVSIPIHDLRPGKLIQIRGSVPHNCGRFQIDLQQGGGIMPNDIGMHFNVRFDDPYSPQPIVVRTNRSGGGWGHEERDQSYCPFQRGAGFEILILLEHDQYKVAVNGQHFITFRHRGPWHNFNHIGIVGEVQIESISQFNT